MSRYTYAKKNLPDWDEHASAELKTRIKAYCLRKVLLKAYREKVFEWITAEIAEFIGEFDESDIERAIGERYRAELTEYATEAYDKAVQMVGNLSPYMFAQALVKPTILTKAQKDNLGRTAGMEIRLNQPAVEKLLQTTPSYTEGGARRATAGNTYYKKIHAAVKSGMTDYTEFKAAAARPYLLNVNQRNIVEMGIRFAKYQEQKRRLIEKGVTIVYVPPHANCSKRCQPFQSRLYSLDGTRGSVDGRQYIPIEEVADNVTVHGRKDPSRVYAAGLFAYNCRHTMVEYEAGQNLEVIPKDVIERQRKIEVEQREREREIRALAEKNLLYRTVMETSGNKNMDPECKEIRKLWLQKRAEYRAFCAKNKIPRYDERLMVIEGEDIYKRTVGKRDTRVRYEKISPQ